MSRRVSAFIFIAISAFVCALPAHATHIFGGDLLYEHVSGNQYRVTLTIYGDCSGESFNRLHDATPVIEVFDGQTPLISRNARPEGPGEEVSPVCPDEIHNTNCKGGTLPGVTRFIYSDTITLPHLSKDWRFVFQGAMGNSSQAGRSHSITNVVGSSVMYLEAKLNNTVAHNSSPKYNTIPTPFYCINISQQYNQGATDQDKDSLAFSLTGALTVGGGPAGYLSGYSATKPMTTTNFYFNGLNGQMSFHPNILQKSVIVNLVQEYRNGEVIGTSMREMTFIILDNCNNNPPWASLDNSSLDGGIHIGNNVVNICEGRKEVSFLMPLNDADTDVIDATVTNVPAGAVLHIINNKSTRPYMDFKWDLTSVPTGNYNIFLNLKDDNCPLSASQTIAYTLQIIKPVKITHEIINPTRCLYDGQFRVNLMYGAIPRWVTISKDGYVIKKYKDTLGYVIDKYPAGKYRVDVTSPNLLCNSQYDFAIVDSGGYPYVPVFTPPHYCINDSPKAIEITPGRYGTIKWYDIEGNQLQKPPQINTSVPGIYKWLVSELYDVCESRKDTFSAFVHDQPLCEITTAPRHVCTGDKILLTAADETLDYEWLPHDKITMERDSSFTTRVMANTTYMAVATDAYGCKDTAAITFDDVEPCCKFSYPDAFTPNGDGVNDGFRAVMYGNEETYDLAIFNRWGQELFRTSNPKEYWNGSFGGRACDPGTYFYLVRGKCMTGTAEFHKGEFILIR